MFVYYADSDLLYISKLRPYITTWLRIPTSHNANRAVRNIALLHNASLHVALVVDCVFIGVGMGMQRMRSHPQR